MTSKASEIDGRYRSRRMFAKLSITLEESAVAVPFPRPRGTHRPPRYWMRRCTCAAGGARLGGRERTGRRRCSASAGGRHRAAELVHAAAATRTAPIISPLKADRCPNVDDLGFAWEYDLGAPQRGQEATPIVIDGVLYTSGTWGYVYAVDAATGRELWRYDPKPDYFCGEKSLLRSGQPRRRGLEGQSLRRIGRWASACVGCGNRQENLVGRYHHRSQAALLEHRRAADRRRRRRHRQQRLGHGAIRRARLCRRLRPGRPAPSNGGSTRCRRPRGSRSRIRNSKRPRKPGMRTATRSTRAAARCGTAWPTTAR